MPRFLCLSVSKTIVSSDASIREAVSAKTSDIRAPVNAIVKQNVKTPFSRFDAAHANANLSRAVRYLRFPKSSKSVVVMRNAVAEFWRHFEPRPLTRESGSEQNTAFCSPIRRSKAADKAVAEALYSKGLVSRRPTYRNISSK
jgi:hypothetical protein